jgi:hypothetical protein
LGRAWKAYGRDGARACRKDWFESFDGPIIVRKGYFKLKHDPSRRVQKYQCKTCGKFFSDQTGTLTYREHKPKATLEVFKWYSSGTTQRRLGKNLGIAKKTVERKFLRLALYARMFHEQQIEDGHLASAYVFFDEMETFEHSKLKPVSIALAVQAKTGKILDAKVARSHPKRNAKESRKQYPHWKNNSVEARRSVMKTIQKCGSDGLVIATDKHKSYPALVRSTVPEAKIEQFRRKAFYASYDPLFWLQHICARIRADLSRMRRRTWVTTKKMERLQAHLDLYIAYNNGYVLQDEGPDS